MSGPYVPAGPWNNGAPPAISAAVLTAIEAWIQQTEADTGSSSINGSTSGTATLYQPLQGVFKIVLVRLSSFRNGSSPAQTIAIPTPFTTFVHGWNTNVNPFQVMLGGSAKTVQQLTNFNSGGDNSVSAQTTLHANWLWHCDTGIDTVSFNGSQGSNVSGHMILFGI